MTSEKNKPKIALVGQVASFAWESVELVYLDGQQGEKERRRCQAIFFFLPRTPFMHS